MKHTKGPWIKREVGHPTFEHSFWIDSPTDIKPALVFGNTQKEAEANARLVETAPELLEALEEALLANEITDGLTTEQIDRLNALVRKAKG